MSSGGRRMPFAKLADRVHPRKDDQVAAWLKHRRDDHPEGTSEYHILDFMLDEYCEAAERDISIFRLVNEKKP